MSIPLDWKVVRGASFPMKEELKALGARWDRDTGYWYVAPERLSEAERLVEDYRVSRRR